MIKNVKLVYGFTGKNQLLNGMKVVTILREKVIKKTGKYLFSASVKQIEGVRYVTLVIQGNCSKSEYIVGGNYTDIFPVMNKFVEEDIDFKDMDEFMSLNCNYETIKNIDDIDIINIA
jgi:hypothetical protein